MTSVEGANQPRWSVGALAGASGLTVRTLHHYEELGLLCPSERTHSGHRRYIGQDLHRLYQIRLLRLLRLSLDEINQVLDDHAALQEVLTRHLDQLDQEVWRLNAQRHQARVLLDQLSGSQQPDSGELLSLLGQVSMFDQYITEEQRAYLDERADALAGDTPARTNLEWPLMFTRVEWPQVFGAMVDHYRADTPVDDPEVVKTTGQLFELVETFTGGDPDIREALGKFMRERGLNILGSTADQQNLGLTGEFWDYVDRAYKALPAG